MNRAQEASLALMILMPLGALITGSVAVLLVYTQGTRFIPLFMFTLALVLGSLFWLLPPIVQKIHKSKKVQSDERDKQIEKNAYLAGFGAVYLLVIVASFAPITVLGEKASIPVTWLPGLLVGAGLCQAYAMAAAILVQYGRMNKETNHE